MEKNEIGILIYAFAIILSALGVFLLLFYLLFKRKQKTNKMKIIALNEELMQTQIEIQERTLKNVSQEIHDNIGQVLSLAKLNLNTFTNITDESNKNKLFSTKELVSKAINDLRDLAKSMHGEKIAEIGLQLAVDNELKIIRNTGQFQTELIAEGEHYNLEPHTQMVLFRVVQELLHNAIKHSKAKNITVNFNYSPNIFTLTVKDDGIGFDTEKSEEAKSGIGLSSMKNRASLIGGKYSLYSTINQGTIASISLPHHFTGS